MQAKQSDSPAGLGANDMGTSGDHRGSREEPSRAIAGTSVRDPTRAERPQNGSRPRLPPFARKGGAALAGISPGGSLTDATTGVCRSGGSAFVLRSTYSDALSRAEALGCAGPFDVVAIGAPILPPGAIHYDARPCEKLLRWAPFDGRCQGRDTATGSGASLRRSGCDTARQWSSAARYVPHSSHFPRVQPRSALVEAFPRAFMALLLSDGFLGDAPKDGWRPVALYQTCLQVGAWRRLEQTLRWPDSELWRALTSLHHREEEVSALVCTLTAICAWVGRYVAVGEPDGGYVFLPPWELWPPWARLGIDENRGSHRLARPVDVWIDGTRYRPKDALPRKPCDAARR